MKILQVVPSLDLGGAETMCVNLSCELKGVGHDIEVVCFYKTNTALRTRLEAAGIRVYDLEKGAGFDVSAIKKIRKILREFRPDVIHGHLYVLKYILPAKLGLGRIPVIHTVHNIAEKESDEAGKKINRAAYRYFGVVPVGLSPVVCKSIENVYGVRGVELVYNGVPMEKCIPKTDYASDNIVICNIARFNEQKNHIGLINAFKLVHDKLPNTTLQLIGDGELTTECKNLAHSLGIEDAVIFEGHIGNVYPHLNRADIFALPSIFEGMPMTLIEAMGTGLAIAATPVGGVVDMLTDKTDALFCGTDAESIADCLIKLCTDAELRRKLGTNARAASDKFSAVHMRDGYLELYNKCLK